MRDTEAWEEGCRAGLEQAREIVLRGDIWEEPCTMPGCGTVGIGCQHRDKEAEVRMAIAAAIAAAVLKVGR